MYIVFVFAYYMYTHIYVIVYILLQYFTNGAIHGIHFNSYFIYDVSSAVLFITFCRINRYGFFSFLIMFSLIYTLYSAWYLYI